MGWHKETKVIAVWGQMHRQSARRSKITGNAAAQVVASARAEIESRFIAASTHTRAPAPDPNKDAESDWIEAVWTGALLTFVAAPAAVPLGALLVSVALPLANTLFTDASTSAVNVWAYGGGVGGMAAVMGIVMMSTAAWRLRKIRRDLRAASVDCTIVREAFAVTERSGTIEAKALLGSSFLAAEQITAHSDVLAGRVDLHINAAAEVVAVARRVHEVELLRIDYGIRPQSSPSRDRWDHATTALDEVLRGMTARVEALSRYTRQLDRLAVVQTQMVAAQRATSLDDRLGILVAKSAIDEFVAADVGRLADEISDLTAGMEAIVAWLGDDKPGFSYNSRADRRIPPRLRM